MSRTRLIVGSLWLLWPLALLGAHVYYIAAADGDWTRWVRLFPAAFVPPAISICGMYFLLGWPGSKWVLRGVALLVGFFSGITAMAVGAHGHGDPFNWGAAAIPLALVVFATYSALIAHGA